jgi:hypothetical protein
MPGDCHPKAAVEAAYAKGACPIKFSESPELAVKGYDKPITGYEVVCNEE